MRRRPGHPGDRGRGARPGGRAGGRARRRGVDRARCCPGPTWSRCSRPRRCSPARRSTSRSASSTSRRWRARPPSWRPRPAASPRWWSTTASTGWLVPIEQATDGTGTPLDPERYVADLAAALVDAVSDPDRARERGLAGRRRARRSRSAGRRSPSRRSRSTAHWSSGRPAIGAMHDRSALGPADVTDGQLTVMVADLLGHRPRRDRAAGVHRGREVDYDLPAITTAGRYWVRGRPACDGREAAVPRCSSSTSSRGRGTRSSQVVPPEHRARGRGRACPGGPRRWPTAPTWATGSPRAEHAAGARRLRPRRGVQRRVARGGRRRRPLSGTSRATPARPTSSAAWRPARACASSADVGTHDWDVRDLPRGPARRCRCCRSCGTRTSGTTRCRGSLRRRAPRAAARRGRPGAAYVDELDAMPVATAHGDACPNNLLARAGTDAFVLIDYGFWGPSPVGFDLAQLLVGDVQVGRRRPTTSREVEDVILARLRRGAAGRGLRHARRRRTARARTPAAHLHRPLHAAVRAPRGRADAGAARRRGRARRRSHGSASTCSTRPS